MLPLNLSLKVFTLKWDVVVVASDETRSTRRESESSAIVKNTNNGRRNQSCVTSILPSALPIELVAWLKILEVGHGLQG